MDLLPLLNLLNAAKSSSQENSSGDTSSSPSLDAIAEVFQRLLEQSYQQTTTSDAPSANTTENSSLPSSPQNSTETSSDDSNVDWSLIASLVQFVPLNQFIPNSQALVNSTQPASPQATTISVNQLPPMQQPNAVPPIEPALLENFSTTNQISAAPAIPLLLLSPTGTDLSTATRPTPSAQQPFVDRPESTAPQLSASSSLLTQTQPNQNADNPSSIPIPIGLIAVQPIPVTALQLPTLKQQQPQALTASTPAAIEPVTLQETGTTVSSSSTPVLPSSISVAPVASQAPPTVAPPPVGLLSTSTPISNAAPLPAPQQQSLPQNTTSAVPSTQSITLAAESAQLPALPAQASAPAPIVPANAVLSPKVTGNAPSDAQPLPASVEEPLVPAVNVATPESEINAQPEAPKNVLPASPALVSRSNQPSERSAQSPTETPAQDPETSSQTVIAQASGAETSSVPEALPDPTVSKPPLGKSGALSPSVRARRSLDLGDLLADYARQQSQQINPLANQTASISLDAPKTEQIATAPISHDPAQVISQVTTAASASLQEMSHIQVELNPHDLGHIRVEVTRNDQHLTARIEVAQSHTHRLLTDSASQLTDSLATQGITVDQVEISYRPNLTSGDSSNLNQGSFTGSGNTRNFASGGQEEANQRRQPQQDSSQQFLRRDPPQTPTPSATPRGARLKDLDIKI